MDCDPFRPKTRTGNLLHFMCVYVRSVLIKLLFSFATMVNHRALRHRHSISSSAERHLASPNTIYQRPANCTTTLRQVPANYDTAMPRDDGRTMDRLPIYTTLQLPCHAPTLCIDFRRTAPPRKFKHYTSISRDCPNTPDAIHRFPANCTPTPRCYVSTSRELPRRHASGPWINFPQTLRYAPTLCIDFPRTPPRVETFQ